MATDNDSARIAPTGLRACDAWTLVGPSLLPRLGKQAEVVGVRRMRLRKLLDAVFEELEDHEEDNE